MEWRECQRFVSNDRKNKEEMCRTTQSHTFVRFVAPFSICIRPKSGGRIELDPLYFGYPLSEWFQFFYCVRIERQKNHFFFFLVLLFHFPSISREPECVPVAHRWMKKKNIIKIDRNCTPTIPYAYHPYSCWPRPNAAGHQCLCVCVRSILQYARVRLRYGGQLKSIL